MKIGLKLWSENVALATKAETLYRDGVIDLIELYVVPGSLATVEQWTQLTVPYMIHCPHTAHGFNLAKPNLRAANAEKFSEAEQFADRLSATVIVTHGGSQGELGEAISQAASLNSPRFYIENQPMVGLSGGLCHGNSPAEIKQFLSKGEAAGFVLDFGHATCAANSKGIDPFNYIQQFMVLQPEVFHIGDGYSTSEKDHHLDFGDGDFDIARLLDFVPQTATLTIETPTDLSKGLKDFQRNADVLRNILHRARID